MAYTREQIGQALKAAHEAGDVEAARTLAIAYRDWKPATPDPVMNRASERANMAFRANEKIAPSDLTQLGRPDFSGAAMSRLPPVVPNAEDQAAGQAWISAMENGGAEKRAYDAAARQEKLMRTLPDSNLKERAIIGMNVGTFGNAPRAAAAAQTLGALVATPFIKDDIIDQRGISGAMSQFLDEARIHQRRAREERPIESFGTEIGLGLLQGKTIIDGLGKQLLPKTNTVSNVSRVAGVGGGYGAVYGGSQSEDGTLQGAAGDAAFGGATGAAFGLGFKAAEPAITAGYRSAKTGAATISDALSDLLGKAGGARDKVAQEVALAAVRRSMERSGMTFDQVMDLVKKYEGKPAVLAEIIGQDALNSLTALTRRPGSTSQKATDIAEARATMLPDRAKGDLEDASGIQIGNIDETLTKQLDERQAAAKPLYDALYKKYRTIESFRQPGQTGQVQKRLNRLARTPLLQRHLELADKAMRTSAAVRGIAVSKMSVMERWDLVKRSLDDAIDSAVAKGEARTKVGESVGDLVRLKEELVGELDRLTGDAYAAARLVGGEAPRLRAAATAGQKAIGARSPKEVAKTVAATLAQDLPAMQAGMVDDIATRIDKAGFSPRRFRSPDLSGKVRAVFGEEAGNRFLQKMDAEAELAMKGSRWAPNVNSVTGTVMESGATAMGDDLINAGFDFATGNKVGFARKAINFMRQRGFSQRQIDAIGDLLLSSPEEGLRRLQVIKPEGPPAGLAAPVAGGPPSGGQPPTGGTPAANAFAQKPGKPGKLGTRTADAAAIASLGIAPPEAQAQGAGSAELDVANERVRVAGDRVLQIEKTAIPRLEGMLEKLQDPNGDPKEKQRILIARGHNLGTYGPSGDGVDGDLRPGGYSATAIAAEQKKIERDIALQRQELKMARKEADAARDGVTKAQMRQSLANAEKGLGSPLFKTGADLASGAAFLGGIYLAGRARKGAVKEYSKAARTAATKANMLLNRGQLYPKANVGPNSTNVRASNLNEFYKQGGAGKRVPFTADDQGQWSARKNVKEPSQLFKAPRFIDNDQKFIIATALESQATKAAADHFGEEADKAQAEMDRAYKAGDSVAFDAALKSRNLAAGGEAFFRILERLGYGLAAGRTLSGLKKYPAVNANIKAAEAERALILQGLQKQKAVSAKP